MSSTPGSPTHELDASNAAVRSFRFGLQQASKCQHSPTHTTIYFVRLAIDKRHKHRQVLSSRASIIKMAPSTSNQPLYQKDEKVLCFHGELLYEAKVMDYKAKDPNDKKDGYTFRVHYKGWKNT
jgi:hypothetical protein